MKKTKTQKGITLIALIITIVVLLILAVVAISSIQNDGILSYANNAAIAYNQAQVNEEGTLDNYLATLDKFNGVVTWTQNGTTVTNGTITLEVGTTITGYDETKDKEGNATGLTDVEWQILGVENGQILIISSTNVQENVKLTGPDDYMDLLDDIDEGDTLYDICAPYGQGINATGARSIELEDIYRLMKLDPSIDDSFNYSDIAYGTEFTYNSTDHSGFQHADGRTIGENGVESITVISNYARFDCNEEVINSCSTYWISTHCERPLATDADFGVFVAGEDYNGGVEGTAIWYSGTGSGGSDVGATWGARAVVYLESNVNIDSTGNIS